MIAAFLLAAFAVCWSPSVGGCNGAPLLFPEQVTYLVVYDVREMVVYSGCSLSETGEPQACMTYSGTGQVETAATCLPLADLPDPPVGVAYLAPREVVAVNPAGRSDECQQN